MLKGILDYRQVSEHVLLGFISIGLDTFPLPAINQPVSEPINFEKNCYSASMYCIQSNSELKWLSKVAPQWPWGILSRILNSKDNEISGRLIQADWITILK